MTDEERLHWYRDQTERLENYIRENFNEGFRTMGVVDTAIYLLEKVDDRWKRTPR